MSESPIVRRDQDWMPHPSTEDAKWLDPECWDGCQSLIHKHRIERLEATLRRVLEWCDQDSPAFELDADAIRVVLNPREEKGQP